MMTGMFSANSFKTFLALAEVLQIFIKGHK